MIPALVTCWKPCGVRSCFESERAGGNARTRARTPMTQLQQRQCGQTRHVHERATPTLLESHYLLWAIAWHDRCPFHPLSIALEAAPRKMSRDALIDAIVDFIASDRLGGVLASMVVGEALRRGAAFAFESTRPRWLRISKGSRRRRRRKHTSSLFSAQATPERA